MTVSELIEELKQVHGDPDLRTVMLDMTIKRPYAKDQRVQGNIHRVTLRHDVIEIQGYGYIE